MDDIKLNKEAFDRAIKLLTECKKTLIEANEDIVASDNNMKKDWIGEGGNAFLLSANFIEASLFKRIEELDIEINDLMEAQEKMFEKDNSISKIIDNN